MIVYLFIFDDSYFDLVAGQRCPSLELEIFWSLIYLNYLLKGDLPPISWYVVNELASLRLSLCFHSYIHSYFVHHSFNIGDVWCCVLTISILKYLSTDYDECTSNPCLNGGTCVNGKRKFSCICPATHKGDLCEGEHHICNFFLIIMKSQRQKFIIAKVYHNCLERDTSLSIFDSLPRCSKLKVSTTSQVTRFCLNLVSGLTL